MSDIDRQQLNELEPIIRKYRDWCKDKDEGWIYDDIHDFIDGDLSRGELMRLFHVLDQLTEK